MSVSHTLESYLFEHGASYTLEHHEASESSLDTARAARIDEESLAKSVLLEGEGGHLLVVLPASRRLDLSRVRDRLGRTFHLAPEQDIPTLFPDCAPGAVPAVGAAFGLPTILDASLEETEEIFFEAGDHETLVHMSRRSFFELQDGARRADIATASVALKVAHGARVRLYESILSVSEAIGAPLGSGPAWRRRLVRELERLRIALDVHIEKTEASEGLLDEIIDQAPRLAREVDRLRQDHTRLRAECERVLARAEDFESVASIRRMVLSLLGQLAHHRHEGADLVYEAFGVDLGGG
jgi:Ala-tRNA(Pro) deacylase